MNHSLSIIALPAWLVSAFAWGGTFLRGCALVSVLGVCVFAHASEESLPEAGPENGGMRLRLMVLSNGKGTNETYDVKMDLINVTDQPIRLMGDWPDDSMGGDYKEYLRADVSFETYPAIGEMGGQLGLGAGRSKPQPEYVLDARQTLTLRWKAPARRLKTSHIWRFETWDPVFPIDGLYSVRASFLLRLVGAAQGSEVESEAAQAAPKPSGHSMRELNLRFQKASRDAQQHGGIPLRSNEQLIPVGSSYTAPKHSGGNVLLVDTNSMVAKIGLGSAQKIEPGDMFYVHTRLQDLWILKISKVDLMSSEGPLEEFHPPDRKTKPNAPFPTEGGRGSLILQDDPRRKDVLPHPRASSTR